VKCSKKQWCAAMAERITDERRGFNTVNVVNLQTGTLRLIGIRYCLSAKDRGVMLNFCPWCGTDISFFEEEKTTVERPQPSRRKSKSSSTTKED
jgi:hypothetical protein